MIGFSNDLRFYVGVLRRELMNNLWKKWVLLVKFIISI